MRRRPGIIATLALMTLGAVGYHVKSHWVTIVRAVSPPVTSIEVRANGTLDGDAVLGALNIELGDPIVLLNPRQVLRRCLQDDSIATALMSRSLTGEVVVNLDVRQPVALLAGSTPRLIDKDGVTFRPPADLKALDLPVISGIHDHEPRNASRQQAILRVALHLLKEVDHRLRAHGVMIGEVHVDAKRGFSLFASPLGGEVMFGTPPFTDKIARLIVIVDKLKPRLRDIEFLDLDYNRKAVVRFRVGGQQIFAVHAIGEEQHG